MSLLTGKTAIITGATRGIGKAIALKFAKEGANIAFTDLAPVIEQIGADTEKEIAAFGVKELKAAVAVVQRHGVSGFAPSGFSVDAACVSRRILLVVHQFLSRFVGNSVIRTDYSVKSAKNQ